MMQSIKQQILDTINELPDDTTWDDAMYAIYVTSKLIKGEKDIKKNNVITVEESKERMKTKFENYNNRRSS